MKKKIAIIGAGIAGLTLANFLKKFSKHEFRVYEKNESLPLEEGFGIQLSTNIVKILNKINFEDIQIKNIFHPKILDFKSIYNENISELNLDQFNENGIKYTTLKRSILIEFLNKSVYANHLKFNKKIKQVSEIKDKILLKFEDNTNDLVDYVIGADGIFSSTRSFFEIKKITPKFNNAIVVRSIFNSVPNLDINKNNISLLMGANTHLVFYPISKTNEINFICVIRSKKFDPNNVKSLIEKVVLKQNENLQNLFNYNFVSWPLYSTKKIFPSKNKKVFYIGDAFNSFLPTFAQGAGQSIESAYELFNLLNNENLDVFNLYYKKRIERVKKVKKRANFNFIVFHLSNPLLQKIRNMLIKFLVKKNFFIKRYLGEIYKN
tara:strand:- start:684 stop:1817 length:1134 start_codon:yes stop_codon:yes gene_type:complete